MKTARQPLSPAPTPAFAPFLVEVRLPQDQLEWLRDQLATTLPDRNDGKPHTPSQLAERLGVSEDTVRRRITAGTIKRVPDIGPILIPMSEVNRLLGNNKPGGNAQ